MLGNETPAKSASPPLPAPELDAPEAPSRGGNGPLCLAAVNRLKTSLLSLERKIHRPLRPGAALVDMRKSLTILPLATRPGGGSSYAGVTIGYWLETCKGQEHESCAGLEGTAWDDSP